MAIIPYFQSIFCEESFLSSLISSKWSIYCAISPFTWLKTLQPPVKAAVGFTIGLNAAFVSSFALRFAPAAAVQR